MKQGGHATGGPVVGRTRRATPDAGSIPRARRHMGGRDAGTRRPRGGGSASLPRAWRVWLCGGSLHYSDLCGRRSGRARCARLGRRDHRRLLDGRLRRTGLRCAASASNEVAPAGGHDGVLQARRTRGVGCVSTASRGWIRSRSIPGSPGPLAPHIPRCCSAGSASSLPMTWHATRRVAPYRAMPTCDRCYRGSAPAPRPSWASRMLRHRRPWRVTWPMASQGRRCALSRTRSTYRLSRSRR
jgi:hypothetical protein